MSHYLCLTTYFHYLLPTVSAIYRGNCTSSSSSSCPSPRVYIVFRATFTIKSLVQFPTLQSLHPQKDLLQDLERNSATLKSISTKFRNQANNIKIFSCIEQHSTPPLSKLVVLIKSPYRLFNISNLKQIVDRHTGVLDFPGEVIIPTVPCV